MLKLGSNLNNDEFPYGCVDEIKFSTINQCKLEQLIDDTYIDIQYCDKESNNKCIKENGKPKLTEKNISNMRKYLINEMEKKYTRRKGLLESIEQIFTEFLGIGNSKEMLELKMLETVLCGEQKLMLEDFLKYIKFNNEHKHNRYINITKDQQNAIIELIRIHSEKSEKNEEINLYLESLLHFITASKRISNDIKNTGICFNLASHIDLPIHAHTCFNYIDIKEQYLVELVDKKSQGKIFESKLYEWLGPELLKNPLAQTFEFAG